MTPATLDRTEIAKRVPHQGAMCLLETLESWTPEAIHCTAINHQNVSHPMRTNGGLLVACAIEYAAQAMALHGSLIAQTPFRSDESAEPMAGFLASVRNVRTFVDRLDGLPGSIHLHAQRLSGDSHQILYTFSVQDNRKRPIAEGRAVVVLNKPLPLPSA